MARNAIFALLLAPPAPAAVIDGTPANCCRTLLRNLKPGDTLRPGARDLLPVVHQQPQRKAGRLDHHSRTGIRSPAVIGGEAGSNTVEIMNSSYVAIENLRIDSRGIASAFGISARGHEDNLTHHIRIEGNTLVGQNNGQQTDAISTKTPTWGWIIRYNRIFGAGTGLYLGESDGTQPFIGGLIEHNLIQNTIGYNLQIKDLTSDSSIPDMPQTVNTVIRNNVFIKDDQPGFTIARMSCWEHFPRAAPARWICTRSTAIIPPQSPRGFIPGIRPRLAARQYLCRRALFLSCRGFAETQLSLANRLRLQQHHLHFGARYLFRHAGHG